MDRSSFWILAFMFLLLFFGVQWCMHDHLCEKIDKLKEEVRRYGIGSTTKTW